MKDNNDFLTSEEVLEIFPKASPEQIDYIIASTGVFTDLFFEIIKVETLTSTQNPMKNMSDDIP